MKPKPRPKPRPKPKEPEPEPEEEPPMTFYELRQQRIADMRQAARQDRITRAMAYESVLQRNTMFI
jgi:hypothetical protein